LERIAVEIAATGEPFDLRLLTGRLEMGLAERLWNDATADESDAERRVKARSLVVESASRRQGGRAVEFFHRSMREYFVACALRTALNEDLEMAMEILDRVAFSADALVFFEDLIPESEKVAMRQTLLRLARSAKRDSDFIRLGGNALSLAFSLRRDLRSEDLSGLKLDNARLSGGDLTGAMFRRSLLRGAIFDNSVLVNVDFRNSDLSGVRIEETARPVALTPLRSQYGLLAGYSNGTVRVWLPGTEESERARLLPVQAPGSIGQILELDESAMVLKVHNNDVVSIFVYRERAGGEVEIVQSYRCRQDCLPIHIDPLQVITHHRDERVVRRITPTGTFSYSTAPYDLGTRPLVALWNNRMAILTTSGLRLFPPQPVPCWGNGRSHEVTAIAGHTMNDGRECLARGYSDGHVELAWIRQDGELSEAQALTHHAGRVTCLTFLGDGVIASGGGDKGIHVVSALTGSTRRLMLAVQCEGLKIGGVAGPAEYAMLERICAAAGTRN
jgi:hypothetical protein